MEYDLNQLKEILNRHPVYPDYFSGRGIVIVGGGATLPSAYIAVRSLRYHDCSLPIQMWHLGSSELPSAWRRNFEIFGVEFVDTYEISKVLPGNPKGPWPAKPFALMYSPYAEVLLLDADNMALCDPTFLFDNEEYREMGAMFWPDFIPENGDFWAIKESTWALLGLPVRFAAELETGQIIVNKALTWKELNITMHMNEHCEYYYNGLSHGDTATFLFSWMLCSSKMFVVPHRPQMTIPSDWKVRIQFAPDGQPLFQHSRKWSMPVTNNPRVSEFIDEELCFSWLSELR